MTEPRFIESPLNKERGAPPEPLALVGHLASLEIGPFIANHTTLNTVLIESPEDLDAYLVDHDVAALIVQSRATHPGEAARAIATLRRHSPAAAFYQAWDYNVSRGVRHAIEAGADGVLMPGINSNEFFAYLFGVLQRYPGGPLPKTEEEHVALLRELAPSSPFWEMQDRIVSDHH